MRILRHSQIDVTMEVYTEVSDANTLKALKRLTRLVAVAVLRPCTAQKQRPPPRWRGPLICVGVAGFEPTTSSSRSKIRCSYPGASWSDAGLWGVRLGQPV
ncbi:MAG: site-specific integrase [Streptosporangiaceae bacterium]|nr:site-specific integrase [Streptosporangiaceae bacterium]